MNIVNILFVFQSLQQMQCTFFHNYVRNFIPNFSQEKNATSNSTITTAYNDYIRLNALLFD